MYSFEANIVTILLEEKLQAIRFTVFMCISMYVNVCMCIYIYIYIYIYGLVYIVHFLGLYVTVEARRLVKRRFYQ